MIDTLLHVAGYDLFCAIGIACERAFEQQLVIIDDRFAPETSGKHMIAKKSVENGRQALQKCRRIACGNDRPVEFPIASDPVDGSGEIARKKPALHGGQPQRSSLPIPGRRRQRKARNALISRTATGVMLGFGAAGYELAIEAMAGLATPS